MTERTVNKASFVITNPITKDNCLNEIHTNIENAIFRELICKENEALEVEVTITVIEGR